MINGKMAVTLFIVSEDNDCTADLRYTAMYKYNKVSKWLQLELTENKKSNNFAMVEYGFTGAMILKKNQSSFNGVWISPDGKKQMKVVFEEVTMNKKEIEDYENRMERVNYENYDC